MDMQEDGHETSSASDSKPSNWPLAANKRGGMLSDPGMAGSAAEQMAKLAKKATT